MENKIETETTAADNANNASVEDGKSIAIIAYLTLIGLIIAFIMNNDKKNEFAQYHIRQVIGLMLTGLVLYMVNVIPIIGWILSLLIFPFLLYLWISGIINAVKGKQKPIPLFGKKYEDWFKNI